MPGDDQQEACCVLEICCGGASSKQGEALARWLASHAGLHGAEAQRVADALVAGWDFAPKGSLLAFKTAVAEFAREYPYEG